jgi:hypothetical protein
MAFDPIRNGPVVTRTHGDSNGMETLNVGKSAGVRLQDKKDTNELKQCPGIAPKTFDKDLFTMHRNTQAERGHGSSSGVNGQTAPQKTPEQQKFEADQAKFDQAVAQRNAVLSENEAIRKENEPTQRLIDSNNQALSHIDALMRHIDFKDGHFSWGEIENLAARSTTVREAARWLRDNWGSIPKNAFGDVSQGALLDRISILQQTNTNLGLKLKTEKPVPELPPPPVKPATTESPLVGNNPPPGATPPPGNASPPGTTPPPGDAAPPRTGVTPGPLSTTPGMIGLGEGIDGIQKRINELVEDTKQNPANANKNQAEIGILTQQLTALSSLMNQIFTMQSNLAKLYSEMSMTAIRNLR